MLILLQCLLTLKTCIFSLNCTMFTKHSRISCRLCFSIFGKGSHLTNQIANAITFLLQLSELHFALPLYYFLLNGHRDNCYACSVFNSGEFHFWIVKIKPELTCSRDDTGIKKGKK